MADRQDIDAHLRQGLRELPVPEASHDFDARVHAGLAQPVVGWVIGWRQAVPMLATAAVSMAFSLAILAATQAPSGKHFRYRQMPKTSIIQDHGNALPGVTFMLDYQDRVR